MGHFQEEWTSIDLNLKKVDLWIIRDWYMCVLSVLLVTVRLLLVMARGMTSDSLTTKVSPDPAVFTSLLSSFLSLPFSPFLTPPPPSPSFSPSLFCPFNFPTGDDADVFGEVLESKDGQFMGATIISSGEHLLVCNIQYPPFKELSYSCTIRLHTAFDWMPAA